MTGILLGGLGYFWRELLGFLGGLYRKFTDEAKAMEEKSSQPLRRAA